MHLEFPTELVCNGILKWRNVKRVAAEPYRISQQWTLYQLGSEDGFSRWFAAPRAAIVLADLI